MKICILELFGACYNYGDYCDELTKVVDHTDWHEVNEDEMASLVLWAKSINDKHHDRRIVIVNKPDIDIKKTVADYIAEADKHRLSQIEEEKKRKIRAEARAMKDKKRREDAERKKFERIKQQYDELSAKYD